VPDSLTKFKEEGATSGDNISTPDTEADPPEAVDPEGEPIDASSITDPSLIYFIDSGTHNFVLGDIFSSTIKSGVIIQNAIAPEGDFGDYIREIQFDENGDGLQIDTVSASTSTNFLSTQTGLGFQFGTDLTTTYADYFSVNTRTGTIALNQFSAEVLRATALAPINFDFYSPSQESVQSLSVSTIPTVSIQAPVPGDITLQTDTSFNCTNPGTLSAAPTTPQLGDVYFDSGTNTCYHYYNNSGAVEEVAYPYSGPIYVGFKLNSNENFFKDDTITEEDFMTSEGAIGKITYKDDAGNIYGTLTSGTIFPGDSIDNQVPYSSAAAEIENVKYYFEKDANINLQVISPDEPAEYISYDNSVEISITPDLPSTLRLVSSTDSPLFGYIIDISGSAPHDYLETTKYTITVENDISSKEFEFELGIINAPTDLSYSQLVAFRVKNLIQTTSDFYVGQYISTNIVPPLAEGAKGIVRYIIDVDGNNNEKYLITQMISGSFAETASVDNYKDFLDEEAVVLNEPVPLTHIMRLNTTGAFTSVCQQNPLTTEYAKGIVTEKLSGTLLNTIFVNQVHDTQDTNSSENFTAGITTITDCDTGSPYVMNQLWSPVSRVEFTSAANLIDGMDIITSTGANFSVSEVDTVASPNTALLQSTNGEMLDMTALPNLQFSERRPYNYLGEDIANYTTLPTFELKRGENSLINANLNAGESVTYSITPELPQGLSLDITSGKISGVPEIAAASKAFTITATNILGSTKSEFNILIEDYFEVTADIESTPKFFMHKYGFGNNINKCRIKKRDILNNPNSSASDIEGTIDIDCFLEIGENDLYSKKLKLEALAGPGMCHSIEYTPFAYYKKKPSRTTLEYSPGEPYHIQQVTGVNPNCSTATIQSFDDGLGNPYSIETYPQDGIYINGELFEGELKDLCQGNYDDLNCDRGFIEYADIVFNYQPEVDDGGSPATVLIDSECTNTVNIQEYSCDGKPELCLAGPIEEVLNENEIANGFRSTLTPLFEGGALSVDFSTPQELGARSNRYLANYMNKNTCVDAGTYNEYYIDSVLAHSQNGNTTFSETILDPFMGGSPFYTFSCLDEHMDIKARINVHIRDWDSKFEFDNLDKSGSSTDWGLDNAGFSPMGSAYNNVPDWDDYNQGNNYSACNASNPPTLGSNFTLYTGVAVFGELNSLELSANTNVENLIFPGTFVEIGGNQYIIKSVDKNKIQLTLPLLTDESGGTSISGRLLYPFPGDKL